MRVRCGDRERHRGCARAGSPDVDRLPEWNAIIAEVAERPDVVQRDAEWVVEIKAMGTSWKSRSKVEEYDPA